MKPFDFVNSISHTKKYLMESEHEERAYPPFIVNRALSKFPDTVYFANEMNQYSSVLDNKLQYDFLFHLIRKKKRWSKWDKVKEDPRLEFVKEYYGYRDDLAREAMRILTPDQLAEITRIIQSGKT